MNKETIIAIAFWGTIIIGGLWVSGVFGNGSTKTQSYQESTSVYATPIPKTDEISIPQTFNGYLCTVDCSGHEAGYEWAEEHGITDSDDCGGNSQSFIEGCQSYAEETNDDSDSF